MRTDTIYHILEPLEGKSVGMKILYFVYFGPQNCPCQHELTFFFIKNMTFVWFKRKVKEE